MSSAAALEAALAVWACVLSGATVVAAVRSRRFRAPGGAVVSTVPASDVLIVRPCAGLEPTLERALRSTASLLLEPGARAVFAVADPSDAALPVARRVAAELSSLGLDARVVVTRADAPNRKAAQLHHVGQAERGRSIVVSVDSDVDLEGRTLPEITAAFDDPRVQAAWAPPIEAPLSPTLADRASAAVLGASLHAFPLLSGIDERGMVGKLFAIRRTALEAIGGFASLTDVLGEDVELARRLAERGARVAVLSFVVRSLASGRSLSEVVGRFSRWLGVVRAQRPALLVSYPMLFFATLPLVALGLLSHALGGSLVPVAIALASRTLAAVAAAGTTRGSSVLASVAWMPVADLVLAAAFWRALASRRFVWRGRALVLGAHGRLEEA
jgi:ceramide glucosyltransferase